MKEVRPALLCLGMLVVLCLLAPVRQAAAAVSQSPNFQLDEGTIGSGGLLQSSSANFQSTSALGDVSVGEAASTNLQVQTGSKTSGDPTLSLTIHSGNAQFNTFSASTTATTTSSFSVANYTSYGYAVQIIGEPPKNGNHTIDAMPEKDASLPGTEQFGINLVANTSPTSLGANPEQTLFGVGVAAPNYATSNQYRYVSGETIATAPKSSGVTTYTISYIVNVESLTPGGQYSSKQEIICTGTY